MTDAELVAQTRSGDLQAFNTLTRRWDGSLYRFARRQLGNEEDARDVCQEALVKAYLNIGRLRDPAKFKSWAHHIVLNLCRDRYRSAKSRVQTTAYEEGRPDELTLVESGPGADAPPDEGARRILLRETLTRVMGRLPEEQRAAILLKEYQGFTSEEISEITGVPAATVRTRIFYGLKAVRRMLAEEGVTGPRAS